MKHKSYIAKVGRKYLSLSLDGGIKWGAKKNAFRFYSKNTAIQIACAFSGRNLLCIEEESEEI